MKTGWNNLPIEIRIMIINELDFISRASLGACAKLERNLVRTTICKIDEIEIKRPFFWLKQGETKIRLRVSKVRNTFVWKNPVKPNLSKIDEPKKKIIRKATWQTTVLNIFNTIGSKCLVGKFVFEVDGEIEEEIDWFRDNVNFQPMTVDATADGYGADDPGFEIDRFLEWPENVEITCKYKDFNAPFLEKLECYNNIVSFLYYNSTDEDGGVTNSKLMKIPNAKTVDLEDCPITTSGISRWLKQWLVRPDFGNIDFFATFFWDNNLNEYEFKNQLDGFITSFSKTEDDCKFTLKNQSNGKTGELKVSSNSIEFSS